MNYEGTYWCANVHKSNRYTVKVTFTSVASDSVFKVPESRAEKIAQNLEDGKSPDSIAKTLPIEFN